VGSEPEDVETRIGRGFGRILHYDDLARLEQLAQLMRGGSPPDLAQITEEQRRLLQMFVMSVCSRKTGEQLELRDVLGWIWRSGELRSEFLDLSDVLADQVVHMTSPLSEANVPLRVHATYSRVEVLAAYGISSIEKPSSFREGVYWHEESETDLLFVTLNKADKSFSPTTSYKDYAISEELFHWESQSGTGADTKTGKRYIEQRNNGTKVLIFVREQRLDSAGNTAAFFCIGFADYVSHEGEKPIAITWRLRKPLPGGRFSAFRAAVA